MTQMNQADMASALLQAGQPEKALPIAQRLAASRPRDWTAQTLAARVLLALGRAEQARHFAKAAAALAPAEPSTHLVLASAEQVAGKPGAGLAHVDAARAALARLVQLDPDLRARIAFDIDKAEAILAAGAKLVRRASLAAERAWSQRPDDADVLSTLASTRLSLMRPREAWEVLAPAAEGSQDLRLLGPLAFLSNYVPGLSREEVFAAHRAYGACLDALRRGTPQRTFAPREAEPAVLTVGVISSDLCTHSVAFFVEPLFEHHDRARTRLIAYHTAAKEDAVTARLRQHAHRWRSIPAGSDEALASAIAQDNVDVLVELNGHSAGHCLTALHLRPAPVIATYLGYPNTTGVPGVTLRITDDLADPAGSEAFHSERLVRVPAPFLCYRPPADAPAIAARPDEAPLTFVSFNHSHKLHDGVFEAWARILPQTPGSRLLLKSITFAEIDVREEALARLANAGIDPSRVTILPGTPDVRAHLEQYASGDIALDTFPYAGTTTTCEALWMGLPVVTLSRGAHASRVGESLLRCAIGEDSARLIARTEAEYVEAAATIAKDRAWLTHFRETIRARMLASPLCDAPGLARKLEAALRDAHRERWRRQ